MGIKFTCDLCGLVVDRENAMELDKNHQIKDVEVLCSNSKGKMEGTCMKKLLDATEKDVKKIQEEAREEVNQLVRRTLMILKREAKGEGNHE